MHQTVNIHAFREAFRAFGRNNQFSYEAQEVLFEYLEQLEDDIGQPIELDVIALCCEYTELTPDEVIRDYGLDIDSGLDHDDRAEAVEDYLQENTSVCGRTDAGAFVFAQF